MNKRNWLMVGFGMLAGAVLAQVTNAVPEIVIPEQVPGLIDWVLGSKVVSIGKYMAVITLVVQIVKTLAILLGGKLPAKMTAGVVALVGFLATWEAVTADGQINGGDWSALIVGLVATVGAFFGYKVLFSTRASVQQD